MKIWLLPPRFLDDDTLYHHSVSLKEMYDKVEDYWLNTSLENFHEIQVFINCPSTIKLLHNLSLKELIRRNIAIDSYLEMEDGDNIVLFLEDDLIVNKNIIEEEMDELLELWSKQLDSITNGHFIERLQLCSTDDVFNEMQFILSVKDTGEENA